MQGCASAIPLRYALFGLKSSHILPGAQGEIKTQLYRAAAQQLYPFVLSRSDLETVISITVHKSIYRRMFLQLEIDFIPVYWEGYYGIGIGGW